ncbi:sorbitol dehydrogenase [Aureobasidium subglaciale]|nr:sorbitol dehydrogenase [Aureobasidium subglaciale]
MLNPSLFLYGPGNAKLEDKPMPIIHDDHDVIVRIAYVGVCGSDVHFWKHGGIGTKVDVDHPLVMGHEASGTIHAVGSKVQSVKVGDRVAIEPGTPCRRCQACKDGQYNLCTDMRFAAAPPNNHGTLTKFFLVPEDFVYKIAESTSLQEAVLIEPLAVAIHANRLVDVKPGNEVIIFGSGTIGILCAAVAKSFGAYSVTLVDVVESKLAFAKKYIDCATFLSSSKYSPEEAASLLKSDFDMPQGCDVVIEASGAETCMQTGIHALRMGGRYIQTGIGKPHMSVPILALSEKELKFYGCFRYGSGDYSLAVKLLERGTVDLKTLISSITPFQAATDAWDRTARGEGIKNLIRVDNDMD